MRASQKWAGCCWYWMVRVRVLKGAVWWQKLCSASMRNCREGGAPPDGVAAALREDTCIWA
jgi:hypothetical protein